MILMRMWNTVLGYVKTKFVYCVPIVVYQDCHDDNVACHHMQCVLGEIQPGSGITLRLFFRLWNHTFTEVQSHNLKLLSDLSIHTLQFLKYCIAS